MKQTLSISKLLAIHAIAFVIILSFASCRKTSNVSANKNTATTANNSAIIAPGSLVAWYKFTNGITADYSGNNNHLTPYHVTLADDAQGKPNNAYMFDGFSSYMKANSTASLGGISTITMAALIKPMGYYEGTGKLSRILMKGNDDQSDGVYFLGFSNTGRFDGNYGNNQYNNVSVSSPDNYITLGQWYKMVYTYDGAVGNLYINDVLVSSVRKTASFDANNNPLRVGKTGRTDFPFWFNGVIDEIRIYNKALNNAQVSLLTKQLGNN